MHLVALAPEAALGHILRHHVIGLDGRKQLNKGRVLTRTDAALLRELGVEQVRVAVLEPGDVHENQAAQRVAAALGGAQISVTAPAAGRVNLLAAADGVLRVDPLALERVNDLDGVAVATQLHDRLVRARSRVGTVKIIPFALPERVVRMAEELGRPPIWLDALRPQTVGVLLVGSDAGRARLDHGLAQAVADRVAALGSTVIAERAVAFDEAAVAAGLHAIHAAGAQLLIIASETSIMDAEDVVPIGVRLAGGLIEHYGAPVEPGNLLLLAYLTDGTPVLGAPGCVRSRDLNIVDLLLPRLLAGERLTRRAIISLGHGGLLH